MGVFKHSCFVLGFFKRGIRNFRWETICSSSLSRGSSPNYIHLYPHLTSLVTLRRFFRWKQHSLKPWFKVYKDTKIIFHYKISVVPSYGLLLILLGVIALLIVGLDKWHFGLLACTWNIFIFIIMLYEQFSFGYRTQIWVI